MVTNTSATKKEAASFNDQGSSGGSYLSQGDSIVTTTAAHSLSFTINSNPIITSSTPTVVIRSLVDQSSVMPYVLVMNQNGGSAVKAQDLKSLSQQQQQQPTASHVIYPYVDMGGYVSNFSPDLPQAQQNRTELSGISMGDPPSDDLNFNSSQNLIDKPPLDLYVNPNSGGGMVNADGFVVPHQETESNSLMMTSTAQTSASQPMNPFVPYYFLPNRILNLDPAVWHPNVPPPVMLLDSAYNQSQYLLNYWQANNYQMFFSNPSTHTCSPSLISSLTPSFSSPSSTFMSASTPTDYYVSGASSSFLSPLLVSSPSPSSLITHSSSVLNGSPYILNNPPISTIHNSPPHLYQLVPPSADDFYHSHHPNMVNPNVLSDMSPYYYPNQSSLQFVSSHYQQQQQQQQTYDFGTSFRSKTATASLNTTTGQKMINTKAGSNGTNPNDFYLKKSNIVTSSINSKWMGSTAICNSGNTYYRGMPGGASATASAPVVAPNGPYNYSLYNANLGHHNSGKNANTSTNHYYDHQYFTNQSANSYYLANQNAPNLTHWNQLKNNLNLLSPHHAYSMNMLMSSNSNADAVINRQKASKNTSDQLSVEAVESSFANLTTGSSFNVNNAALNWNHYNLMSQLNFKFVSDFESAYLNLNVNPVELDKSLMINARYFIIKSDYAYNVWQSIRFGVWCSTKAGNMCLNEAYKSVSSSSAKRPTSASNAHTSAESSKLSSPKEDEPASDAVGGCFANQKTTKLGPNQSTKQHKSDPTNKNQDKPNGHVILFFSIRESGYLSGVAEMTSCVNLQKRPTIWRDLRFRGEFSIKWLYIKNVPNQVLKHILIECYENRPVTVLRDTSELLPASKGEEFLQIVHNYYPDSPAGVNPSSKDSVRTQSKHYNHSTVSNFSCASYSPNTDVVNAAGSVTSANSNPTLNVSSVGSVSTKISK